MHEAVHRQEWSGQLVPRNLSLHPPLLLVAFVYGSPRHKGWWSRSTGESKDFATHPILRHTEGA